jgi:hypothetical protein
MGNKAVLFHFASLAQPNHLIELLSYAVSISLPEDKAIKYVELK